MTKFLLSVLCVGLLLAYVPDAFGCDPPRALRSYGCQGGAAAYNSYVAPQAAPCPTCSTQPTVPFSAPQATTGPTYDPAQVQQDQIVYVYPRQQQYQYAPAGYAQRGFTPARAPGYCAPRQSFQPSANVNINVRTFTPPPPISHAPTGGAFATAGRGVSSGFGSGAGFSPGPSGGSVAKSFSLTGPFGGGIRRTVVRQ